MFSAALTAIYMFRLYFVTFWGSFRGTHEQEHHVHEGPLSMTLPLIVLSVLSIFGGILNLPGIFLHGQAHWMGHLFERNVAGMNALPEHKEDANLALMLMIAAAAMSLVILIVTFVVYGKKGSLPKNDEAVSGWEKLSANKLYFDELYNAYTKFNAVVENTPNWMPNTANTAHGAIASASSYGKPLDWQRALHGAIGMCTESAEILDLFKKELYGKHKPLHISHVMEELGDNLFYMVVIMRAFDIDIRHVLGSNVMKLANRYIEKMQTHV
jgi:NADH:ubiquinone oxidoreductase subunit 5 (subunit L)/multisubunit Na+/H+ antiporter MnhA subunit